jgi:hypothetical protein
MQLLSSTWLLRAAAKSLLNSFSFSCFGLWLTMLDLHFRSFKIIWSQLFIDLCRDQRCYHWFVNLINDTPNFQTTSTCSFTSCTISLRDLKFQFASSRYISSNIPSIVRTKACINLFHMNLKLHFLLSPLTEYNNIDLKYTSACQ